MLALSSEGSSADEETHTHAHTHTHTHTHTKQRPAEKDVNRVRQSSAATSYNIITLDQTRHYTDRKALYTNAYHTLTLQWECVSKPTSSPLAIIFLCVSASVSTVPFTPNNWKSTTTLAHVTAWQICDLKNRQTSWLLAAVTSCVKALFIMSERLLTTTDAGRNGGFFWEKCCHQTPTLLQQCADYLNLYQHLKDGWICVCYRNWVEYSWLAKWRSDQS